MQRDMQRSSGIKQVTDQPPLKKPSTKVPAEGRACGLNQMLCVFQYPSQRNLQPYSNTLLHRIAGSVPSGPRAAMRPAICRYSILSTSALAGYFPSKNAKVAPKLNMPQSTHSATSIDTFFNHY